MSGAPSDAGRPPVRVVFVVGAPRSGTTWMQSLLGAHADVVTPQETDLFSTFVAPLQDWWDRQLGRTEEEALARRAKGLPAVLDDEQFTGLMRQMIDTVLDAIRDLDPDARVLVEKSPSHSRHTALIRRYLPDARFIHIIRDGRDVVSSMQAAAQGWGRFWAPTALKDGATTWRTNVHAAREADGVAPYLEVRYEDLRAGSSEPLRAAFELCGIDVDADRCAELLEEFSLERMKSGTTSSTIAIGGALGDAATARREPTGFYGSGSVGGWRESWSRSDRELFDSVAGDLLVDLGYETGHDWAAPPARRRWYQVRTRAERKALGVGRRIGRWSNRRLRRLP